MNCSFSSGLRVTLFLDSVCNFCWAFISTLIAKWSERGDSTISFSHSLCSIPHLCFFLSYTAHKRFLYTFCADVVGFSSCILSYRLSRSVLPCSCVCWWWCRVCYLALLCAGFGVVCLRPRILTLHFLHPVSGIAVVFSGSLLVPSSLVPVSEIYSSFSHPGYLAACTSLFWQKGGLLDSRIGCPMTGLACWMLSW